MGSRTLDKHSLNTESGGFRKQKEIPREEQQMREFGLDGKRQGCDYKFDPHYLLDSETAAQMLSESWFPAGVVASISISLSAMSLVKTPACHKRLLLATTVFGVLII